MDNHQKETDMNNNKNSWMNLYHLLHFSKTTFSLFVFGLVLSVISVFFALLLPDYLQQLIDAFSRQEHNGTEVNFTVLLIVIFLFQLIFQVFGGYCLNVVGIQTITDLRFRLWKKIVKLPIDFFHNHEPGEISSRIINDTGIIYELVTTEFPQVITAVIYVLVGTIKLFLLDKNLTLVLIVVLPLFFLICIPIGRLLTDSARNIQEAVANLSQEAVQMASSSMVTKICGAEEQEIQRGKSKIDTLKNHLIKQIKILTALTPLVNLMVVGTIFAVIAYGGIRVARGSLTVGTLISYMALVVIIINPINNFSSFYSELMRTKGATGRIINILHEQEEDLITGSDVLTDIQELDIDIEKFVYPGENNHFLLHDVRFSLKKGKKYALVGPSGGGKTTILKIIDRLYPLHAGKIMADDHDFGSFALGKWRRLIGYVSQDYPLISGTIRENLLYGLEDVSEDTLIAACKLSCSWDFIAELPRGLDTVIGGNGGLLSGGQRQRISIARALIHKPKILLFDESTANLDNKSEQIIQQAVDDYFDDAIIITIAHRLSTIIDSDLIFYMDDGTVTGRGTHDWLMKNHLNYQNLYNRQKKSKGDEIL